MEKQSSEKRFALLIDADNVSAKYIKPITDELSNYGTVTIKRIYGDWTLTLHAKWKDALLENSLTPIQQFGYTQGKNATDSAMIIDAMDILYTGSVEGFCIVSSDSDFTRLASRLRESGRMVIGMGEKKTPTPFRRACDVFTTLELLLDDANGKRRGKQGGSDGASSGPSIEEVEQAVVRIITDNQNNGKSTGLGEVGSRLLKRYPDFDVRSYGTNLLSKLLSKFSSVQITKNGSDVSVELADDRDAKPREEAKKREDGKPRDNARRRDDGKARDDGKPRVETGSDEAGADDKKSHEDAKAEGAKKRDAKHADEADENDEATDAVDAAGQEGAEPADDPKPETSSRRRRRRGEGGRPGRGSARRRAAANSEEAAEEEAAGQEPAAADEKASADAPAASENADGAAPASELHAAEGDKREDAPKAKTSKRGRRSKSATPKHPEPSSTTDEQSPSDEDASKGDRASKSERTSRNKRPSKGERASKAGRKGEVASENGGPADADASPAPGAGGSADAKAKPAPGAGSSTASKAKPAASAAKAVPAEINDTTRRIIAEAGADGLSVAELAGAVRRAHRGFKLRDYGYAQFRAYVATLDDIQVIRIGNEWIARMAD